MVRYDLESGIVALQIDNARFVNLRRSLAVGDRVFDRKSEFHITIIGSRLGQKLLSYWERAEDLSAYSEQLSRLAAEVDWEWRFEPQYYHVVKSQPEPSDRDEGRYEILQSASIIQMVSLPGIDRCYQQLSSWLGKRQVPPALHVTLYVSGNPRGIGIADRDELNRYAVEYRPDWV